MILILFHVIYKSTSLACRYNSIVRYLYEYNKLVDIIIFHVICTGGQVNAKR